MIAMIIWERAEKGVTLNNCVWHVFLWEHHNKPYTAKEDKAI